MEINSIIHRSETRGLADYGWLLSRHTFSFAEYFHPERMHFGALRVLNDDIVDPGAGFPTHPHDNMEIVSIPLRGALEHKDSMGNIGVIQTGEVQRMSAGTGITHSEYNHSKTIDVNFLQIWILPEKRNIKPSYEQKEFSAADRMNRFQFLVSPDRRDDSLWINQNCFFSLAEITPGTEMEYIVQNPGNGIYFFVTEGKTSINGLELKRRDGAGFTNSESFQIKTESGCGILAIETVMN